MYKFSKIYLSDFKFIRHEIPLVWNSHVLNILAEQFEKYINLYCIILNKQQKHITVINCTTSNHSDCISDCLRE